MQEQPLSVLLHGIVCLFRKPSASPHFAQWKYIPAREAIVFLQSTQQLLIIRVPFLRIRDKILLQSLIFSVCFVTFLVSAFFLSSLSL